MQIMNMIPISVLCRLRRFRYSVREKLTDDSGVGVIEVILILLVLVGLVIIFKGKITTIANSIFSKITSQADSV